MKIQRAFLAIFTVAACTIYSGCDSDSASSPVTITPASAIVSKGQSVQFTAAGGYEYTWSIEEDSAGSEPYGTLSTRHGSTTTYTSLRDADSAAVVRILTVTSTIEDAGQTNSLPEVWTAEAYITHSAASDASDDDDDPLSLSPTSATLSEGESQEFRATDGAGTYSWSISPSTYGELSANSGSDVVYRSTSNINASVTVTVFSGSESRVATVTHVETTP